MTCLEAPMEKPHRDFMVAAPSLPLGILYHLMAADVHSKKACDAMLHRVRWLMMWVCLGILKPLAPPPNPRLPSHALPISFSPAAMATHG